MTKAMSDAQCDWSVDIHEQGRSGRVDYVDASGKLSFHWEFGGGDTVATIYVGDEAEWRERQPWAVAHRAAILQRIASEVIRRKAPGCRAEIDDRHGWMNIRESPIASLRAAASSLAGAAPTSAAASSSGAASSTLRVTDHRSKVVYIAAVAVVALALAFWAAKQFLSIRAPYGTPLADSVRAGDDIATLISSLEGYIPSLHRDPADDRYRLALFLYPVNGSSPGRMIPLAKELRAVESSRARLFGGDGRTVWFDVNGLGGVELATGRRIGTAELRAANPAFAESWDDTRRVAFDGRLRIESADRRTLFEIDPPSLRASAVSDRKPAAYPFRPAVVDFLASGVRPAPTEWLGLHSPGEAERDYKLRSWLSRADRATEAKELRRFHRGQLGPELDRGNREILGMTALSSDEYLNAAFVRNGAYAEPLRLADPAGYLMIFTSTPGLGGTLAVARVDAEGRIAWKIDTGIDRFRLTQILPDVRHVAFIGTRPAVPDKLSEPILVSIDTRSGAASTTTLWK